MRKIIFLNLILLVGFIIGYLLKICHFPYLLYLIGSLIFFLPGVNLALAVEQITRQRQGINKIFLWSQILSFTFTPAFIYFFSLWKWQLANESITIFSFSVWWLLSLMLFLGFYWWQRFKTTDLIIPKWRQHAVFWWALAIFLIVLIIIWLIYPYIPEADSYTYLVKTARFIKYGEFLTEEIRYLFYVFSWTFSYLSQIPLYWLFKLILPLLAANFLIVFYQISRKVVTSWPLQLLATLGFLFFPVIILEIMIPRSQSLFLISLPISLWLLTDLVKNQQQTKNIYWLLLLLLVSLIGIKIHLFFIFLTLFTLIAAVVFLWPKIKKYPLETILIAAFLAIGSYPWLVDLGITDQALNILRPFWRVLIHPKIDLWFIDHYQNVDGKTMGWPGYSWLYYYGYNLGLALPILLILAIIKKVKIKLDLKNNWLYFFSFLFFFAIAEFFPRIGLAYLPDRAWLLTVLSLGFFWPLLIKNLSQSWSAKIIVKLVAGLIVISILISLGISWAKQGWTNHQEYQVAEYIKTNLPKDAVIISQVGNLPLISYFSDRIFCRPPEKFFLGHDLNFDLSLLRSLPDYLSQKKYYLSQEESLENLMTISLDQIIATPASSSSANQFEKFSKTYHKYVKVKKKIHLYQLEKLDIKRPIYILYSKQKFSNLYNQRAWWRQINFYQANLKKFNQNPKYFQQIYNQNGILIWRVK